MNLCCSMFVNERVQVMNGVKRKRDFLNFCKKKVIITY